MTQSFFKKDKPSPSDKEKLETVLFLLEKISTLIKKPAHKSSEIKEILDITYETAMDLSFDTPHLTKEDLLKDIHMLKTMAEKKDLTPMVSYLDSVSRLIRAMLA